MDVVNYLILIVYIFFFSIFIDLSNSQNVATFGATTREHIAARLGSEASEKAVFALPFDFARLIDALDGKEVDAGAVGDAVDIEERWRRQRKRHVEPRRGKNGVFVWLKRRGPVVKERRWQGERQRRRR